jgi:hypothetical protein
VGVLAHELLTGRTPWSSLTDKEVIRREIKTMRVAPPLRLSPPAGALVCALLSPDRAKRLGTRADADLQSAKFFASVDWAAVAAQQAPPALAVGADCVAPRDRDAALAAYQARHQALHLQQQQHASGPGSGGSGAGPTQGPWYLGLPVVEEHPEVVLGGLGRDRTASSGLDGSRDGGGGDYF